MQWLDLGESIDKVLIKILVTRESIMGESIDKYTSDSRTTAIPSKEGEWSPN